jgi:ABC-type multidrug transport system permease subunit
MKIIYRSKLSTFLVLLAPILIVFLIGSAFNSSSLNNIRVGTYSSDYNELVSSMVNGMSDNGFQTQKLTSQEDCIQKIKQGLIHVCVAFPDGLTLQGSTNPIVISVDNSRMNIVSSLTNAIESRITSKGSELGVNMINEILTVLKQTRDSLPAQKTNVDLTSSNLNSISSVSFENLSSQISSLEHAISKLEEENLTINGLNALGDLNATIEDLNSLNSDLEDSLQTIGEESTSGKERLILISTNLAGLIQNLSIINANSAENIISPIRTEISAISKDSTNWKYLYPTLVALILLLSGVVLSSSIVLTEKKERARFRNFMTPTSNLSFVLGAYLTGLIILLVQMAILLACTSIFTNLNIITPLLGISVTVIMAASVFLFIGMFIGYTFRSDETTILASISVAALLIFFSNAIIPVESIKGVLRYIAIYNPFYVADSLLRKAILFNEPLWSMIEGFIILLAASIIFLVLCLIARKMNKRFI